MSKMFSKVTATWNPVTGCTHACSYCWARRLVEQKKMYGPDGFKPQLHRERLTKKFRPGDFIFVCDMGDLFCDGVDGEWIFAVLEHIREYPKTDFLLLTKNPAAYCVWDIPDNCILGATIETNWEVSCSKARQPSERIFHMAHMDGHRKMLSIEPIMDFDMISFTDAIRSIRPQFVYIGFDNYHNGLPEPSPSKASELADRIGEFTSVIRKTWREG